MNNVIQIANRKRKIIGYIILAAFFLVLCFAAVGISALLIKTNNLNGDVRTVTGILREIVDNDEHYLVLENDDEKYITSEYLRNLPAFSDKVIGGAAITLTVPERQLSNKFQWIIGLSADNVTILSSSEGLQIREKENNVTLIVGFTGVAAALAAIAVLLLFRSKIPETEDSRLTAQLAAFTSAMFPRAPLKKTAAVTAAYGFLWIILAIMTAILGEREENTFFYVILGLLIAASVVFIAGLPILAAKIKKKSISFYTENFPFDLRDISHLKLKEEVKTELRRQIQEWHTFHPDRFDDFANGFIADFTENGIKLYEPPDEEEGPAVDAREVFQDVAHSENILFQTELSYNRLKLSAVAEYAPTICMMQIFIVSNLTPSFDYPVNLKRDLCFVYDKNLQNTLDKYSVEVEGLKNLVDNRESLMKKHCKRGKIV